MRFSRSLVGYSPAEADEQIRRSREQAEAELRSLDGAIRAAHRDREDLLSRERSLQRKLDDLEANRAFLDKYQEHFRRNVLSRAKMDARFKIDSMQREKEVLIEDIETQIAAMQERVSEMKNLMAPVTRSLDQAEGDLHESVKKISAELRDAEKLVDSYAERLRDLGGRDPEEPRYRETDLERDMLPVLLGEGQEAGLVEKYSQAGYDYDLPPAEKPAREATGRPGPSAEEPKEEREAEPRTETPVRPTVRPRRACPKGAVVLVAVEDADSSLILRSVLEREGMVVVLAGSGEMVSQLIREHEPPDVVILDSLLPYYDGSQLIRQMRSSPYWKDVYIIVLSSEHTRESVIGFLNIGADDSIAKPFDPREIAARVRRLQTQEEC